MARLYAGASGFAYPAWKPDFYPAKTPQAKFLEHYASRLNSVEINYTFRRTPTASSLQKWIDQTPDGFVFSVKAHQRITHFLRLKEAGEATTFFLDSLGPLRQAGRLGVVLFQLPPHLKLDLERLEKFLPLLPADMRCAFEFRHESWHEPSVYEALRRSNACLCQAESETLVAPDVMTADFVYFRLRKADYSADDRAAIGDKVGDLLGEGRSVFLYFKHEDTPHGALYAEELLGRFSD
ncbi:MAG: DUF72 domain-containing protein [Acidobacteria bacterium]|nr:DUF72 domain-containing protein [Acidobacteriota bacterium]